MLSIFYSVQDLSFFGDSLLIYFCWIFAYCFVKYLFLLFPNVLRELFTYQANSPFVWDTRYSLYPGLFLCFHLATLQLLCWPHSFSHPLPLLTPVPPPGAPFSFFSPRGLRRILLGLAHKSPSMTLWPDSRCRFSWPLLSHRMWPLLAMLLAFRLCTSACPASLGASPALVHLVRSIC